MSRLKELYIEELEKEWADLEAQGVPTDKAYNLASARAEDKVKDRLANIADMAHAKLKEGGW